jgi:hypothetical protein
MVEFVVARRRLIGAGRVIVVHRDRGPAAVRARIVVEHGDAVARARVALRGPDRVFERIGVRACERACRRARNRPVGLRENLRLRIAVARIDAVDVERRARAAAAENQIVPWLVSNVLPPEPC